ncbi:MAG: long-chain fatty acid--CoA ligase [Kofleriaceae bacterium]|nr:MAG: long-chain fatty acid--CoA ligase [Kofleriaceae bacterium]MBZ0238068.1 long-chain fatty acid--CoA ligase [Kofleriaceae bacterium]
MPTSVLVSARYQLARALLEITFMSATVYEDLVTLGEASCRHFAERPLFGEKRDGAWRWTTYGELQEQIDDLRGGLAALGVGPGDVIAIIAANRVAWAVAAYATYGLGAIFVPMYEQQRAEDWRYTLADSGAVVVFASSPAIAATIERSGADLPRLRHVVTIDAEPGAALTYAQLLENGREHPIASRRPSPEDTAGLVYTSGTTGKPKGVVLSHRNLASNVAAATSVFPIAPSDRSLSFLPWAHVYGQVVELHILLSMGASSALNDRLDRLMANLLEVRPTILVAVPRVFHRLYARVEGEMRRKPAFIRALFERGVRHATALRNGQRLGLLARIEHWLADRLLFRRIRALLGGRLRYAISASAALSPAAAELIDALGIPVYEGYGLTETSPVVTTNRPGARRFASVGQPIPGVTVTIARNTSETPGSGEIIVHGPNVMRGYHGRAEETARTLTTDGGFRTGDLGYLDEDGYLHVTGRLKEQYKLENGKYVMPTEIEQTIARSPYVANVLVTGANRPFNVALIVLDVAAVKRWASEHGYTPADDHLGEDERVRQLLRDEVQRTCSDIPAYAWPGDVALLVDDFTIDAGLMTPSLKLRRDAIHARYQAIIDDMYAHAMLPVDDGAQRLRAPAAADVHART